MLPSSSTWEGHLGNPGYDTSGRIRMGPAPKNLVVPPYEFLDRQMAKIG
jgi:Rieske Fe-S protein